MEVNTTTLLPYILDLLSRQPDLCEYSANCKCEVSFSQFEIQSIQSSGCSIDELCIEIKGAVMEEVLAPYGSLVRAVQFAVELGMDLGLLSLTNKRIRIPFRFFSRNKLPESPRQPKKSSKKTVRRVPSCDIFMHFVIPNIL